MSDPKQNNTSKSRSRKKQAKTDSPHYSRNANDSNNNSNSNLNAGAQGLPLLKKLGLEHIKPNAGLASRELYIDYALDMVIENLIKNGHLDPAKAPQMCTPVMKSQIASLCDKMLSKKSSKLSTGKPITSKASNSQSVSGTGSKSKTQKWAVQPASLPITIITNQIPPGQEGCFMEHSANLKKLISSKSNSNATEGRKKKARGQSKKAKSLDLQASSIKKTQAQSEPSEQFEAHRNGTRVESTNALAFASSEAPSSICMMDNNNNKKGRSPPENKSRIVQFKGSDLFKSEAEDTPETGNAVQKKSESMRKGDGVVLTSIFQPPSSGIRNRSAGSCPSSTKTANTYVISNSSLASTNGYQILVDMKGFQNEEISMEVEERQLIFLASRPKRDGLNIRKVTEIVDVPHYVIMENLKIGRRVDGYVVVEEHDPDIEQ